MTTKTNPKNESLLAFLTSVLRKAAEGTEEQGSFATGLSAIAEEVKYLTKAVSMLASAVQRHNVAISELYASQEFIIQQLKPASSSSVDTKLPSLNKDKSEKPN